MSTGSLQVLIPATLHALRQLLARFTVTLYAASLSLPVQNTLVMSTTSSGAIPVFQPLLQPAILNKQVTEAVKIQPDVTNKTGNHNAPIEENHSKAPDLGEITVKPSKELIQRHLASRKILRRQLERKLGSVPYPKTYRQVWPVIPVSDPIFLGSVGLEAVCSSLDPTFKTREPKRRPSTAPKPVCQQCGSDYAPAWQVRKKSDTTYLLCEMCDFANLKSVHRDKIASQLKELSSMVNREFSDLDRKFEDDIRGQVQRSVNNLYQPVNTPAAPSYQFQSFKVEKPAAIAQSVIQSSSAAAGSNLTLQPSQHIQPLVAAAQASGRHIVTKQTTALPSSKEPHSDGHQKGDWKKKRDGRGKVKSPPMDIASPPAKVARMMAKKKLKHSGTERSLDRMLEKMKVRASMSSNSRPSNNNSPVKDVIEISDDSCSSPTIRGTIERVRHRKPTTPKCVKRPPQQEVLQSTDPTSCIVVIDSH